LHELLGQRWFCFLYQLQSAREGEGGRLAHMPVKVALVRIDLSRCIVAEPDVEVINSHVEVFGSATGSNNSDHTKTKSPGR
jgi:hypothetical protein